MDKKTGTPLMGIIFGLILAGAGALVMFIGFWKVLILAALFGIGYFVGAVDNKQQFFRDTANRLIPNREKQVLDFKSEITREQEEREKASDRE